VHGAHLDPAVAVRASRMTGAVALACAGMLLGWSGALAAQSAVVAGVVMDTAGRPLEAVQVVAMRSKLRQQTDARGRFELNGLPRGKEVFQVRRVGYQPQVFDLELDRNDTLRIGITLARDTLQQLPEIRVDAPPAPTIGEKVAIEARERILRAGAPASALVSRGDLAKSNSTRLVPILLAHGLKIRVDLKGRDQLVCPRDAGPPKQTTARPAVYLDGAMVDGGESNGTKAFAVGGNLPFRMEDLDPTQIELVEIYASSSRRPSEFNATGANCTVLIWTRR
jgi:hypothetical protein